MAAKRRASRIGVVGLGYVGLPLAVEFGKQYETIGFDVNPKRVAQLRRGRDLTLEVTAGELKAAKRVSFTTELERLKRCQVFIVTVPTPDRKSTRLNSSHLGISYAVFCLKKKKNKNNLQLQI